MVRLISVIVAFLVFVTPALPAEPIGRAGVTFVFIWRDRDAQREAFEILRRDGGANPANMRTVLALTSCVVPKGTRVERGESISASFRVIVIEGPHVGCRGVVQEEDLSNG